VDGYTFVTVDDPYWPEGITPDASQNNTYTSGDVVLMKRPLLDELRYRKQVRTISDDMAMSKRTQFQEKMREDGFGLTRQDEDLLNQMLEDEEKKGKLGQY